MSFVRKEDVAFLGTAPVSTEPYVSPAHYALEQERTYGRVRSPRADRARQGHQYVQG